MKSSLYLSLALALFILPANADKRITVMGADGEKKTLTIPTPPIKQMRAVGALEFLKQSRTEEVFKTPLDLSVENATLEQVVARIKTGMVARKVPPLPRIDIRGVQPIKLSFSIKNSTVGDVLNSAATLAGGKLWILGDYAVISPDMSLSAGEQTSQKEGLLSSWGNAPGDAIDSSKIKEAKKEAFYSFITSEIAQGGTVGELPPLVRIKAPGQGQTLGVNDLSPDARLMLSIMVENFKAGIDHANIPTKGSQFNLASQDTVHLGANKTLFVNFTSDNKEGKSMSWGFDHVVFGHSHLTQKVSSGTPLEPPTASLPPLVPSAGKS